MKYRRFIILLVFLAALVSGVACFCMTCEDSVAPDAACVACTGCHGSVFPACDSSVITAFVPASSGAHPGGRFANKSASITDEIFTPPRG